MAPSLGIPLAAWAAAAVVLSTILISLKPLALPLFFAMSHTADLRIRGAVPRAFILQGSSPWQKSAPRRYSEVGVCFATLLDLVATGLVGAAVFSVTGFSSLARRITVWLKSL